MTTQLPTRKRPDAQTDWECPDVLFEEARRRRRRRWIVGGALIVASVIAGALIVGMAGGGGGRKGVTAHGQSPGPGSDPNSHARVYIAMQRIGVAALTVSLPKGWRWVVQQGNYRNCANPIGSLDLASYRLPVGFGKHEGPIVVPRNGILLELGSAPIRSAARPWRRWRLSNRELRPAHDVGPNRYAAEVNLSRSPAVVATAWFGSIPSPKPILAAANRILRSLRIDQAYGCQ